MTGEYWLSAIRARISVSSSRCTDGFDIPAAANLAFLLPKKTDEKE